MDYHAAQAHLSKADPHLQPLIATYGDCTISPHDDHYGELVSSIVGQQLSVKAADTIWKRTLALFDGKTPTPEQLRDTPAEILRSVGMSNAKASYVKDLAEHVLRGQIDFAHITSLSNAEIIKELTAVKGIGEWTVHMFLIFSLGRMDVLAWGDLGVRTAIKNVYGLSELPAPKEVTKIAHANGWAPYEAIACWYLWRSLENKM